MYTNTYVCINIELDRQVGWLKIGYPSLLPEISAEITTRTPKSAPSEVHIAAQRQQHETGGKEMPLYTQDESTFICEIDFWVAYRLLKT